MTTTTNEQTVINVDENPTATNTVAFDEPINFRPPPPPPPPPNTAAVDEPINFPPPPTPPTNTVTIDKPINSHPPTINTAAVDKPINLQQTPTNTVTVDKPLNFQPPLTKTAAVGEPLVFQPAPADEVVDKVTIPKSVEDTVVVDDAKNLTAQVTSKLSATGLSPKAAIVAVICGSSLALIILGIASIIPLLQLIIGWRYSEQCPIYWRIPHYLVIAGSVGLAIIILGIIQAVLKLYKDSKPNNQNSVVRGGYKIVSVALVLLNIFTFCWFIAGCIWVFQVWSDVQYKKPKRSDYCHPVLYRFAYWLLFFHILYSLFTCCRTCNQARGQITNMRRRRATPVPTTEP